MSGPGRARVVSVTPLGLQADSRSLRIATSVARLGYESIVVEGAPSRFHAPPGFRVISLDIAFAAERVEPPQTIGQPRPRWRRVLKRGFEALPAPLLAGVRATVRRAMTPVWAARYLRDFLRRYRMRTLAATPPAALYYLHSPLQYLAIRRLCRRHRARFVYDAHDFYSRIQDPRTQSPTERWVIGPWIQWLERRAVRDAAAVVTVSEGLAHQIALAYGRRPLVLRNAHDSRFERVPPRTVRQSLALDRGAFLVVCVGQAKPGQALHESLHAMQCLPREVHLAFIGRNLEQHRALVDAHGVGDRVHLVPPVPADEIVPFIRDADAAVVLYVPLTVNYEHCLPNGFFQGVAAGLPLCVPPLPELRRIASEHGVGLFIDPASPESIAQGLRRLYEDSGARARLATASRAAAATLSWEREEEGLATLLRELLPAEAPAPPQWDLTGAAAHV